MANINQEIDTIRVGGTDYEVSDPHALYGEHDESAPDLVDVPLYESDLVTQVTDDSTKPSAANVPYQLKQEINQISSDLASKMNDYGSVKVVHNGTKTIKQCLDELYTKIDPSKIRPYSVFNTSNLYFRVDSIVRNLQYSFTRSAWQDGAHHNETIVLNNGNSVYLYDGADLGSRVATYDYAIYY